MSAPLHLTYSTPFVSFVPDALALLIRQFLLHHPRISIPSRHCPFLTCFAPCSPVKYPLVDPRNTSVCLITKDPQREYKDLLETNNIRFINRVVGITKLKGKWKPFEARRLLLQENGLFLADERVVPLLPKLLGSAFFKAKKYVPFPFGRLCRVLTEMCNRRQPIPVNLTRKDLKGELERAISSTYMHQNQGTCTCVSFSFPLSDPS